MGETDAEFPRHSRHSTERHTMKTPAARAARRRKRAEKAVIEMAAMKALQSTGAKCGTCAHFSPYPHQHGQMMCDLKSDSSGFTLVKAADFCLQWKDTDNDRDTHT